MIFDLEYSETRMANNFLQFRENCTLVMKSQWNPYGTTSSILVDYITHSLLEYI
jgi:hypothetical protein